MYKVKIGSSRKPKGYFDIFVHPCLIMNWLGDNNRVQKIWRNGKSVQKYIDGEMVDLVDIPADTLYNLGERKGYKISSISLAMEFFRGHEVFYADRNPIDVDVELEGGDSKKKSSKNFKEFVLLDYSVPTWYMELSRKYQQLKEKVEQLEQELLHEKYKPGGSGYNEAKRDFEQLGRIDVKVSNKKRK